MEEKGAQEAEAPASFNETLSELWQLLGPTRDAGVEAATMAAWPASPPLLPVWPAELEPSVVDLPLSPHGAPLREAAAMAEPPEAADCLLAGVDELVAFLQKEIAVPGDLPSATCPASEGAATCPSLSAWQSPLAAPPSWALPLPQPPPVFLALSPSLQGSMEAPQVSRKLPEEEPLQERGGPFEECGMREMGALAEALRSAGAAGPVLSPLFPPAMAGPPSRQNSKSAITSTPIHDLPFLQPAGVVAGGGLGGGGGVGGGGFSPAWPPPAEPWLPSSRSSVGASAPLMGGSSAAMAANGQPAEGRNGAAGEVFPPAEGLAVGSAELVRVAASRRPYGPAERVLLAEAARRCGARRTSALLAGGPRGALALRRPAFKGLGPGPAAWGLSSGPRGGELCS